jgi:hypothetical protein
MGIVGDPADQLIARRWNRKGVVLGTAPFLLRRLHRGTGISGGAPGSHQAANDKQNGRTG